MKNLNKILVGILFLLPFCLASCTDEDNMELNKGEQPLTLVADEIDIVLDVTAPESNAVTFNWTSGSNQGTNAAITYAFELAPKGANFANAVTNKLDKGTTSFVYKTEDLNAVLLNNFGILPNTDVELEARVTATIHDQKVQTLASEIMMIKVTTYKDVSKTLYIIGDAAPNGWVADNATKMNSVTGAAGGFVWQGKLKAGKLKFITTLGEFTPSYNKGADDTKLYYRETGDDSYDEQFEIPTAGVYKITLNIINLAIKIEALEAPEYGELWLVGNPTGWSFKPMNLDASDPFIFHFNADLSAGGEFKIGTKADFSDDVVFLRPAVDKTPAGTNLDVVKWSKNENAEDHKWDIVGGIYKIKIDTREMKIDIVPFVPFTMIYLVGDATPNGWDIGNATPLTAVGGNANKFTWKGTLNAGDFKFTCDKQSDWNGAWFIASMPDAATDGTEQQMIFSAKGAGVDYKWKVTTAGTYTIELDQLQETITIKKN
ncbi:SusF/SusE family outer membrane protein [Bacteroides propionicifaciens]|uniref:SusF/SusE family outer membrane protein n=1 Tax=Bacteroides propionicifaciens TaxID=392838 RepID=UPI0003AAF37B|nr:SusF/SusE family outer membrane protein [Bacteroides propionicifaciens]